MALSQILLLSCLAALARADGGADGAHRAALAADLSKHGEALRKGEPLPADMPEHKQAKLKAAFATADPGTGWIGPKELSSLMASCGEAVDEAKCEAIITAAAAATSRVATGTMNEQEFYKLMMGEIEA